MTQIGNKYGQLPPVSGPFIKTNLTEINWSSTQRKKRKEKETQGLNSIFKWHLIHVYSG